MVLEVPLKKVKLVIGPGGERIKLIERKSKARLQACSLLTCDSYAHAAEQLLSF